MSACVARTAFPPPVARALRGSAVLRLGHIEPLSGQLPLPLVEGTPGRVGLVRDLPCAPGPPDERRHGALPLLEGEGPGLGRPALAGRQPFDPVGKLLAALGVPQLAPRVGVAAAVLQVVVDGGPLLLRRVRLGGPAPLVERAPGLEPFPVPGCELDAGRISELPYGRRRLEAVLDAGLDRSSPLFNFLCSRVYAQSSKPHRLVRISGTTPKVFVCGVAGRELELCASLTRCA